MSTNLRAREPITFIEDALPDLIMAGDQHSLRGAAIAGEYLAEQPGQIYEKNYLADRVRALAGHSAQLEVLDAKLAEAGPVVKPVLKVRETGRKWMRDQAGGLALMSVALLKAERREDFPQEQFADELHSAFDSGGFWNQHILRDMLRHYYNKPLNGQVLQEKQLRAIRVGRQVARQHANLSPAFYSLNMIDGARYQLLARPHLYKKCLELYKQYT